MPMALRPKTMAPDFVPTLRTAVAIPWAFVFAVTEGPPSVALVPGCEMMVKVHGSFATGWPWLSTTKQVAVTVAPVPGAGLLTPAVTPPTGGGYWGKATAQHATTAMRTLRPAADIGARAL